jgi:hypothetical protein
MNCPICYNEYPDYKFVSGGCCSIKVCKACIETLEKCPQCKVKYFWSKKEEEEEKYLNLQYSYIQEQNKNINLQYSLELAEKDIKKLAHRLLDQGREIKELKEIIKADIKFSHQYQNRYEQVILKYHLNLI